MAATIQVNKRGGLTLPKALRKSLGIEKGGVVMVEEAPEAHYAQTGCGVSG